MRKKRPKSRIAEWADAEHARIERENKEAEAAERAKPMDPVERERLISYYTSHFGGLFWKWVRENPGNLKEAFRIADEELGWRRQDSTESRVHRHKSGTGKR